MNELKVITEQKVLGKSFRIYGDFSNPLFLAKDVAEWIEHTNSTEMLRGIDEDEKLNSVILSAGQKREVTMLTEYGLYEVLMQSRKPIAKQFKKKVKEILKEIRTTGKYEATPALTRKTYKGEPVMTVQHLSTLLGMSRSTIKSRVADHKGENSDYQVLRYGTLQNFKIENNCLGDLSKSLAVFGKTSALAVLAYYGRADLVPVILNYFKVEQKQVQPPKKKKEPEKPIPHYKMDMAVKILSAMPDGEFKENACKNLLYDIMGEGFMRSVQFIGFSNDLYDYLTSCPEDIREGQARKALLNTDPQSLTPKAAFFFRQAVENAMAKI